MPTLADFQEDPQQFVAAANTQADITKQDPVSFAHLTAQSALQSLYDQGLNPVGETITNVFTKALEDSNSYHAHQAEQQEAAQLEAKKRIVAVTPIGTQIMEGKTVPGPSILQAEERTKANVEVAKQKQLEQYRQTA